MISDGVELKIYFRHYEENFQKDLKLFNLNFEKFDNNIFQKKYSKIDKKIYLLQNF